MQTITVKLPEELVQGLEALAAEHERSKSYYVRKAVARLLEDMEDIRIAEERLAKGDKGVPLEQVLRENGLLHIAGMKRAKRMKKKAKK